MPFDIGSFGAQIGGDIIGTGMGLLLEHHNDQRQLEQQRQLTNIQEGSQSRLMDYQAKNRN